MYIHEAIQARTNELPYICRISWFNYALPPIPAPDVVDVSTAPCGNRYFGCSTDSKYIPWTPTAYDLVADDWIPTCVSYVFDNDGNLVVRQPNDKLIRRIIEKIICKLERDLPEKLWKSFDETIRRLDDADHQESAGC